MNHGSKQDAAEWLHQIAEGDERSVASVVVEAVTESLGIEAVGRLIEAVKQRAETGQR